MSESISDVGGIFYIIGKTERRIALRRKGERRRCGLLFGFTAEKGRSTAYRFWL